MSEDAVSLHHSLLAAGKPSPLDSSTHEVPATGGAHIAVSEAVHHAKTALLRHC